jgi:hypothetical protein
MADWEEHLCVTRMRRELHQAREALWGSVAKSADIRPDQKCVHSVYLAEHYCDVCRLAPIDPDYNPDIYRVEISKALAQSRRVLTNNRPAPSLRISERAADGPEADSLEYETEGEKNLKEVRQIIDIEIWKASKKYGGEMNAKLAYTIAHNQAGKFLGKLIEEQAVESTDANGDSIRVPRFASFDVQTRDESGEPMETSVAEQEVKAKWAREDAEEESGEWMRVVVGNGAIDDLRKLAATFQGSKRLVAEAMLRPGFNVRNVPGVPKSTVGRVRQVILREFKSLMDKGL